MAFWSRHGGPWWCAPPPRPHQPTTRAQVPLYTCRRRPRMSSGTLRVWQLREERKEAEANAEDGESDGRYRGASHRSHSRGHCLLARGESEEEVLSTRRWRGDSWRGHIAWHGNRRRSGEAIRPWDLAARAGRRRLGPVLACRSAGGPTRAGVGAARNSGEAASRIDPPSAPNAAPSCSCRMGLASSQAVLSSLSYTWPTGSSHDAGSGSVPVTGERRVATRAVSSGITSGGAGRGGSDPTYWRWGRFMLTIVTPTALAPVAGAAESPEATQRSHRACSTASGSTCRCQ